MIPLGSRQPTQPQSRRPSSAVSPGVRYIGKHSKLTGEKFAETLAGSKGEIDTDSPHTRRDRPISALLNRGLPKVPLTDHYRLDLLKC